MVSSTNFPTCEYVQILLLAYVNTYKFIINKINFKSKLIYALNEDICKHRDRS